MDFDFSFGRPGGDAGRPDEQAPFRILVLGNFSGAGGASLAHRKPLRVDVDSLDQAIAQFAPKLSLDLDGVPVEAGFANLEDFHPDELFRRIELFAGLRGLRNELRDPALFRRAATALGTAPPAAAAPAHAEGDAAGASDIERLLGRKPVAAAPEGAQAAASGIDALVRQIVAPHVVHGQEEQQHYLAAADQAIAEHMRRVLHDPQFQALEALWRGVERLVRELDCSGPLELWLMDYSRADLTADVAAHAEHLAGTVLQRLLCGQEGAGAEGRRWSLLVCDQSFGPDTAEIALLALLASMAARAGAPLLAAARPALLGCDAVADLASAAGWPDPDDPAVAAWNALRGSGIARHVGLALPRVLVRLPYGKSTDPVAAFDFEEFAAGRAHERYLWGSPALALALLAGRAFEQDGWNLDLDDQQVVDDLPSHVYRDADGAHQQPCAELAMSEPAGTAALARGVMPLLSYRDRNAARLLRWQSIAAPAAPLAGPWSG